ncbi:MAG TPA: hypothetical protein VH063_03230 [Gaiellaceae bacterium]|nr:hypothetical protein [Gaiellaceae bacterium]
MRLLSAAVCALALTAVASAAAPAAKHTKAGNASAKSSLLTVAVLGKGWKATAGNAPGLKLSCPGFAPSGKGIVETGVAGTGSLSTSSVGPFVSQATSVYATPGQAATYWKRAVTPGLVKCIAETVDAIGAQGVKVAITKEGSLPLAKVTDMTTAYRVVATLSSAKRNYNRKLYFDVILIGSGKTLTEITVSSIVSAVPAKVEAALATIVAHKIGVQTA